MKKIFALFKDIRIFKYYLLGIIFSILIHSLISCSEESSPVEPDPPAPAEEQLLNEGAAAAETAFLSGDVTEISNVLTEHLKEIIGDDLSNVSTEKLITFGEALKSRQLETYGEIYAEYNFTKDGIEYSAAFAKQEDGTWKLMRF